MDEVFTIKNQSENTDIIKKSKFIAKSFNVSTKEDAEQIIDKLKVVFSDATHICYAYSLITGEQKFSDDGEPQGTAGMPILNCIVKQKLKNTMIVVIRYFGGIKLGAGGLTRAYSNSASSVIKLSDKKPLINIERYYIVVKNNEVNKLEKLKSLDELISMNFEFNEVIKCNLFIKKDAKENICKFASSLLSRNIDMIFIDELYI